MIKSIRVFAPATVANVGCAFDVLGFAVNRPGDEVKVTLANGPGVRITQITGDGGRLPRDAEKNTATVAIAAMLKQLGLNQGIEVEVHKQMPLGSGLGSSAASAAAGVFAANALLGTALTPQALLPFAMEGERAACGQAHADNVAPALFGGFVLIRSYQPLDIIPLSSPADLYCTVVHPDIELKTSDARRILRKEIQLKDAVTQWGNVAGLVAGLLLSDLALIGRSLQDVIIEPERALLVPGFPQVKQAALKAGALGCSLSGSGPSIFAFSGNAKAGEEIAAAMRGAFAEINIKSQAYVSQINRQGPRILEMIE